MTRGTGDACWREWTGIPRWMEHRERQRSPDWDELSGEEQYQRLDPRLHERLSGQAELLPERLINPAGQRGTRRRLRAILRLDERPPAQGGQGDQACPAGGTVVVKDVLFFGGSGGTFSSDRLATTVGMPNSRCAAP
jgi:hypothetical protein